MRTADAHLRRGVGCGDSRSHRRTRLARRGYTRLSLETGSGQAFEPALALYRTRGFTNGDAFGSYKKSPFNQFLHLDIVSTAGLGAGASGDSRVTPKAFTTLGRQAARPRRAVLSSRPSLELRSEMRFATRTGPERMRYG